MLLQGLESMQRWSRSEEESEVVAWSHSVVHIEGWVGFVVEAVVVEVAALDP